MAELPSLGGSVCVMQTAVGGVCGGVAEAAGRVRVAVCCCVSGSVSE